MQSDLDIPDISMTLLDYTKMKGGQRQIRLTAESGDRYDDKQFMDLREYTFAQYALNTEEVDAAGWGGFAHVELTTLDVKMTEGVSIVAENEDIELETKSLEYHDSEKTLKGGKDELVFIRREDGTDFSGKGFSANVRARTFEFAEGAEGVYVFVDKEEEAETEENADTENGEEEAVETGGLEEEDDEPAE